jgi:hypothetical protein
MKLDIDDCNNSAELLHYQIVLLSQIIENQNIINDIDKQLKKLQSKIKEEKMTYYISQLGANNIN